MANILIKSAKHYKLGIVDILISDHIIKDIAPEIHAFDAEIIDANGLTVIPGLVDMQVHLREPGQSEKETIHSGTSAAARGGFTTIACMPNTNPCLDNKSEILKLRKRLDEEAHCKVKIIPAMTKDISGHEICDFKEYKELGIIGVTDDGKGVQSDEVMKEVFLQAKKNGLTCFQHCEVEEISKGAPLHFGEKSKSLGVEGQTGQAESEMVRRDIELLESTGGHYHVLHMSSKDSLEYVLDAKSKKLNVTAEVTPHHLLLCDDDIADNVTYFKMNPPLRSSEDKKALQQAFINGDVDFVTTDHAPHTFVEKQKDLNNAPFGIIGLETSFPLLYTHFVKNKKMTLELLIQQMSLNPINMFDLDNGKLEVGELADLSLVDLEKSSRVSIDKFHSKSENSPFIGWDLFGWSVLTMCNGKITYKDRNYDL